MHTATPTDPPPCAYIAHEEFDKTASVRGRKVRLAEAAHGATVGNVAGDEITLLSPHRPDDLRLLRYVCAMNGWRITAVSDKHDGGCTALSRDGQHGIPVRSCVVVNVNRIGAQVVDVEDTGFRAGWYYGERGAWTGYGVAKGREAGPWYRFDAERGLTPCPAADAIAWLTAAAKRRCAMDADMVGSVEIG